MASTIAAITTGVGGIVQTADASGNLSLLSGASTIVEVTPAGAAVTGALTGTSGAFSTTLGVTGVATLGAGAVLGTPASVTLTNATGLPIIAGTTGNLSVARGGTGVTSFTGTGNNVLSDNATLVAPVLGTPASGTLTNATGLPIIAGTTGTLSVLRGGSGVAVSTGTGNLVLSDNATLLAPVLGTPASGNLTNCTALNATQLTTGTVSVARGGSGVTTSTGTGNNVLSDNATLVAPALGTPASGNLANCTGFPAVTMPAGSVLQVLSTVSSTAQTLTSTSYVAISGLSVSITPQSASNKVLVQVVISATSNANDAWGSGQLRLFRGATAIGISTGAGTQGTTTYGAFDESYGFGAPVCITFLDSPATTAATAYTVQSRQTYNSIRINYSADNSSISTITVTEIKG